MKHISIILWLGLATTVWGQDRDPFAEAAQASAKPNTDPFAEASPKPQADDPFVQDGDPLGKPSHPKTYQNNVGHLTEFIEIDPIILTAMLSDDTLEVGNGSEVRRVVDDYFVSGKATLIDSCFVSSQGGTAKLSSTAELIYPVEWDMGETFHGSGAERRELVPKVIDGVTYWPPTIYPHPTTFQERPIGIWLMLEASMTPSGKSTRGVIEPGFSRFAGRSAYGELAGKPNELAGHWLPLIESMSTRVSFETPLATTDWISSNPLGGGNPVLVFNRPSRMHRMRKPKALSPKGNVTVIAECLEVDASWFEKHVRDDVDVDSVGLRTEMQTLIDGGQAQVVGIGSVSGLIGTELRSSGARERAYPTDYDPPEIPTAQAAKDSVAWPPASFPAPTAFETRNVDFGVSATIDDLGLDRGYQLKVRTYQTLDGGDVATSELITPTGKVPMTTMPRFISASVETTVFAHRGETVLLGAMTPRAKDLTPILDKRWLMFLRLAK
jgi:hypothetical protein